MSNRAFVLNIIRQIEEKFNCISYAYSESNTDKTFAWWNICINDYELYTSNIKIKQRFSQWHCEARKIGIKILFCYCNPLESKLLELAEEDNLILNV